MPNKVLITGGTGGLGTIVCQKLKDHKYELSGPELDTDFLDLSDEEVVSNYVEGLSDKQDLKAAIFIAGGFAMGSIPDTGKEELRKMFALNFETAYNMVRALLPIFETNGSGQFILIGARPGLDPEAGKGLVAYSLSKSLVFKLSELINAHGKGKNIRSAVIVPSIIDTPGNRKAMPDADTSKWTTPVAIADAMLFILSDSGSHVREGVLKMYNES